MGGSISPLYLQCVFFLTPDFFFFQKTDFFHSRTMILVQLRAGGAGDFRCAEEKNKSVRVATLEKHPGNRVNHTMEVRQERSTSPCGKMDIKKKSTAEWNPSVNLSLKAQRRQGRVVKIWRENTNEFIRKQRRRNNPKATNLRDGWKLQRTPATGTNWKM